MEIYLLGTKTGRRVCTEFFPPVSNWWPFKGYFFAVFPAMLTVFSDPSLNNYQLGFFLDAPDEVEEGSRELLPQNKELRTWYGHRITRGLAFKWLF